MGMRTLGIVGGGLSGLALAHRCVAPNREVTVFEADARLGGQIHSERVTLPDGALVIEHGAEGFVANSAAAEQLARDLGIEGHLVLQQENLSFAFDGEKTSELLPGEAARLLGFQVPKQELGRGIRSLAEGTGQLTDALAAALAAAPQAQVLVSTAVHSLERAARGWRLIGENGPLQEVETLALATTARAAGRLLEPHLGELAQRLAAVPTLSSVNVSLAYTSASLPALRGSGFVAVGGAQTGGLRACSYSSLKLPGRATPGYCVLRAFFRPEPEDLASLPDSLWVARAAAAVRAALGVEAEPVVARVARWANALPVHQAPVREVVLEVERALEGQALHLVGSAFHGSGIDAALRSVDTLAARLA
jgi:protoporphyrinogen/coproporphyrinogen III oxidase